MRRISGFGFLAPLRGVSQERNKKIKTYKILVAVFAVSLLARTGMADPISFSTGSYLRTGIGAEFSTDYDIFSMTGLSGVAPLDASAVEIATFGFSVGGNCYSCTLTPSGFTTGFSMTIDGDTHDILFPWSWASTGPTDTLTIGVAAPVIFGTVNGGNVIVTGMSFLPDPVSSTGGTVTGGVYATFQTGDVQATLQAVPEPASMLLLGSGLAGFVALKKRLQRS